MKVSRLRIGLVCVLLVIVWVAMTLTSHQMAALRFHIPRLSDAMNWLEFLQLPFDMDHVVFFSMITFAARLVLPRLPWWWLMLAVASLAAGTELIQYWVPGRTPNLLDVRDDVIGGAFGLLSGSALQTIAGWALRVRRSVFYSPAGYASRPAADDSTGETETRDCGV